MPGPLQQEAGDAPAAGFLGYRQAVHLANGHAQGQRPLATLRVSARTSLYP
ncbi:hypothetical protein [Streptomyces sp. Wh19]|uniref:Uncharacterized protein n=1 Tax=Streptomyces sanglieri TaxID=193460 RepID=A0ABW2X9H3_9ACTN|nr:hypothetical protein [Streptomyces sp. Wh19]MDV9197175.1 hypothetical protein [Streptomyces sp. Wh19]